MSNRAHTPELSRILAIDTSTEQHGIALFDGERCLELSLPGGRNQTTHLLQQIEWILGQAGWSMLDIDATAVATGPGSFTGLRVGLAIAKGLAIAQDSAVIGVPTLAVTAQPWAALRHDLIVVAPAGRSRLVWALTPSGVPADPVNTTEAEFLAAVESHPDALVVGEVAAVLRERLGDRMPGVPPVRSAAALAAIGRERLIAGDVDDPVALEPIYLHGTQTGNPPRRQSPIDDTAPSQPMTGSCVIPRDEGSGGVQ